MLKFDFDQAEAIANDIKKNAEDAKGVLKKVGSEINGTKNYWVGASANAYIEEYNRLSKKMDEMVICVEGISTQLKEIAKVQQACESDIEKAIKSAN